MGGVVVKLVDGLRNLASGLGMAGQDKTASAVFTLSPIGRPEIDAVYRGTWLGRKIHDIPAADMTREWRSWQADDNQIEALELEEKRLDVRGRVRKALVEARLYGGSAIVLGLPGAANTPAPKKIGKGQLRYVHVMNRHELTLGDEDRNLESDSFGQPKNFEITTEIGSGAEIHPSRMIVFKGKDIPRGSMGQMGDWFWGDPLLLSIRDALVSHDTTTGSITALLQEAKTDVIHIPNLMDIISNAKQEADLIARINLAAVIKSITNTLILDGGDGSENSGEQWEVRQLNLSGMPDLQRSMFQLVSGAADIPATRLIGESPKGMNATGESDTRNYYDRLSSEQESDLTPALAPLDEYLIMSATGARDAAIYYEWTPLWQLTPVEKADRDQKVATTAKIYSDLGAIPGDALAVAIQNRLIEDGVFPGLEAAIEEAELEANMTLPPLDPTQIAPTGAPPEPGAPPAAANANTPPEPMTGNSRRRAANDRARKIMRDRRNASTVTDSTPRPLYVSRKVLNGDEILKWARGQGIENLVPASEMHVTIAASRDPVDWIKVGGDGGWSGPDGKLTIPQGGAKVVERLSNSLALEFGSWELTYRHESLKEAGASWDFADYRPHVTLTKEAPVDFDPSAVEAYPGRILLGPEIFEEFVEGGGDRESE